MSFYSVLATWSLPRAGLWRNACCYLWNHKLKYLILWLQTTSFHPLSLSVSHPLNPSTLPFLLPQDTSPSAPKLSPYQSLPSFIRSLPYPTLMTWTNISTTLLPRSSFLLLVNLLSAPPAKTPSSVGPTICLFPSCTQIASNIREEAENFQDLHYSTFMASKINWAVNVAAILLFFFF